jgi:arginine deiminase
MDDYETLEAAFGGEGWIPRARTLREEVGDLWAPCGLSVEWGRLRSVLLHRPGPELDRVHDPSAALMLDRPDPLRVREQHRALEAAYREAGVEVHLVAPPDDTAVPPNLMFAADLFFMTPEGAILARPASAARAGEERWVQRRLAHLGVPILRAVGGDGTFEGADAMWLDPATVLLGQGLRTNQSGADQVAGVLEALGVQVVRTELPRGTMHLMGQLRIVDRDLALYWKGLLDQAALNALEEAGYGTLPFPDPAEARDGFAHNFVTLAPREILMPAGCRRSREAYEKKGIGCRTVEVGEIARAAGGIGCLTGVVWRE